MEINHVVTTKVTDKDGNITFEEIDHNAITTGDPVSVHNGLVWLLDRAFADGAYYDPADSINKMEIGTGTASNSGLGSAYGSAPTTTRIAFNSSGVVWDISTLTAPKVTVRCDWDSAFDALTGITEVGLFADGIDLVMIAYKNYTTALTKTTGGTISITWEITFS